MAPTHHVAMSRQLVSVVMAAYNRGAWVARAVESVLTQTHRHVELLAVDDGSTDDTARVLESFGPRVRVLRQAHAGAEVARNLGLRRARGRFVAFIDSDDVWHAERLSSQLPLFEREEVGLVFGDAALLDYSRTPPRRLKHTFFDNVRPGRGRVLDALARGCFVPFSSVIVRRRCFDETGGFVVGRGAADYLKWVEIAARYEFDYVAAPVYDYAMHAGGLSHDLVAALEDRAEAFAEMLARTGDAELRRALRRALFNTRLSLRIARLRRGHKGRSRLPRLSGDASPGEMLRWSLGFASDKLGARGRRLFS
jgi:glycosyltransferase involved in cell wall biosynthesis